MGLSIFAPNQASILDSNRMMKEYILCDIVRNDWRTKLRLIFSGLESGGAM